MTVVYVFLLPDYIRKVPKFLTQWPLTCFEEVVKWPLLWAGQNATVEVTSYSYTHKRQYCYKRISPHTVAPLKALTGRDASEYRDAPSRHCINLWSLTHQLLVNYVKTHLGNWGQREQHTNEMLSLIASCFLFVPPTYPFPFMNFNNYQNVPRPVLLLLLAVVPQLLALASGSRASAWPGKKCRWGTVSNASRNNTLNSLSLISAWLDKGNENKTRNKIRKGDLGEKVNKD